MSNPNKTTGDDEDTAFERGYEEGSRIAWRSILVTAASRLDEGDPLANSANFQAELDEARSALRRLCADHGDNDWGDDLSLTDVIDRHLAPYLDDRK